MVARKSYLLLFSVIFSITTYVANWHMLSTVYKDASANLQSALRFLDLVVWLPSLAYFFLLRKQKLSRQWLKILVLVGPVLRLLWLAAADYEAMKKDKTLI